MLWHPTLTLLYCVVPSVSAVAQQILWNCLIEDPALVLRHFLEKLTVSNRQVGVAVIQARVHTHTHSRLYLRVFPPVVSRTS